MIDDWIREAKDRCPAGELGMILVHNGIVRATSKDGSPVSGMLLTYDRDLLHRIVADFQARPGIAMIRAWINEGDLRIGDSIMVVMVAGRFRTDVLPVLQELLTEIKTRVVREEER